MSVLGIYKREAFSKTLRIGTPDPAKYHDARSVRLEGSEAAPIGSKIPPNSKFGLPGVVIPHSKRDGGSMGWDSEAPMKVYIDPEQTNGQIKVDIASIRRDPGAMTNAIKEAFSQHADHSDAIVEAFAKFAEPISRPVPYTQPPPPPDVEIPREAPMQMRNTYVVPKASPGGGQVKAASFVRKPDIQERPVNSQAISQVDDTVANVASASRHARSLHDELAGDSIAMPSGTSRPMKKVTFELPMIGQQNSSLGQFPCYYHDVIREDLNLVLVYDHSCPTQFVWFPPALEDPQSGEPLGIAVLVHGALGEPNVLYKAFPTGVRFKYRNEEFCLLTVEREKNI